MVVISVEGLVVSYADARAVDGVSFEIGAGRTVALLGESGAGKSTLALALIGLLPRAARVVAGAARFAGKQLLGLDEEGFARLRGDRIAIVFQEAAGALDPVIEVAAQVGEALVIHGKRSRPEARAEAIELLRSVGIADPARVGESYPHQLSGGMQKRVMIAGAIACRPALLIADEPTAGLDVTVQAEVLALLDRMGGELQMALLLITHDLGVAAERADDVLVMYAGQIVESGRAADLFARPAHHYTAGLLAALPRPDDDRAPVPIRGAAPAAGAWPSGCRFRDRCPEAQVRCEQMPLLREIGLARSVRCHFPLVNAA